LFKTLLDKRRLEQVSKQYDKLVTLMRPLPRQEIAEIISEAMLKMDERDTHRIYQGHSRTKADIRLLDTLSQMTNRDLQEWLVRIGRMAVDSRLYKK